MTNHFLKNIINPYRTIVHFDKLNLNELSSLEYLK